MRLHCERNGWELLSVYCDDGQSAKNFDRANWKELEAFIKKNHREIDYVVVPKYDRFSRNVREALRVIETLEHDYNIAIISVMEPLGENPGTPGFFLQRMQMLTYAEFEWRNIRERTIIGQHRAAVNGRCAGSAPYGYVNARDDQNKPILLIEEDKAVIVRKIYSLYLGGAQFKDIGTVVRKMGFLQNGNSAIRRVLENPLYAGYVRVPAMYEQKAYLKDGLHERIVDRGSWHKVQDMLAGPMRNRTVLRDEVPLRGELRCHCGKHLTAAPSKGKTKYYWYYFCPDHRAANLSANKLHGQFEALCAELSLPSEYMDVLRGRVEARLSKLQQDSGAEVAAYNKQLNEVKRKLEKLEEKYVLDEITRDAYERMANQWQRERMHVEDVIAGLSSPIDGIKAKHLKQLHKLGDIASLYHGASLQQKQAFTRVVFDGKLYYEGGVYRTPHLLGVFMPKLHQLKEKRLLFLEQPLMSGKNSRGYPTGELNRTLSSNGANLSFLLELITNIKIA